MWHTDAGGGEDAQLVKRILAGETDLYRQVVVRYEARLLAYLARMLGDFEQGRDVTQDTFVAAYASLGQWRAEPGAEPGASLGPWLYRIATNLGVNALRARRRRGDAQSSLMALANRPDAERSLEDRFVQRELLDAALRSLPPEDGACLVLHLVAGERYAEIGARLGMSSEAVRKRVARGVTALREAYCALDVEARR
jgi:RNA polymerase sigma-70 factor (ECF subfamily)